MTDQELRDLVRDAISRHARTASVRLQPDDAPSHMRFPLASGSEGDGSCLIEPTVRCVHCGYCQSYGH